MVFQVLSLEDCMYEDMTLSPDQILVKSFLNVFLAECS